MAAPTTQPILVRDGNVVPTAVGVSDPSLTLVEFTDGVGFFLAKSFQHDGFSGLDSLENVSLRKYSGDWWNGSELERVVLCWDMERWEEFDQFVGTMGISPNPWVPAVFFLTEQEYRTHQSSLAERVPELVFKAAFDRAAKVAGLNVELTKLRARHQEAIGWLFASMPGRRVQPKKETIRISLPPKPAGKETIRLELPPRKPPEDPPPAK